jgi:signal transduction histidine kinase
LLRHSLPGGTIVIAARSPLSTYHALAALSNLLTAVTAGAMLVTALASWLYARAALRPIDRVVRAVGVVRDGRNLTQRVSHRGPHDELGRLVATFNGMLVELDAAYRSLDQSNERMRQSLADCSHELRAPLTRVRSAMDLLSRLGDDDPEFRSRTITAVATETDRMSALVRNLLLARADAGANIQRRPVRLADVLTAARDRVGRMADGITLHSPPAAQPDGIVVDGDADHLEQLVLILLDNAFKYTPPPGDVWLDTHLTSSEVLIAVRDTGLGIPVEDLPHVFDRFHRGRNASGTGLGLAIARWIAGQHGGSIDVASTSGGGSTFTIHLPLA